MSYTLHEKVTDKYRYIVLYDDTFSLSEIDQFDFDTQEDREEYKKMFIDEKMFSYIVLKEEKCTCCDNYKLVDSLSGLHYETPEEALDSYLENKEEV